MLGGAERNWERLREAETLPAIDHSILGVNAKGIYKIIIAYKSHANLFVMTFIGYYNLKAACFKPQKSLRRSFTSFRMTEGGVMMTEGRIEMRKHLTARRVLKHPAAARAGQSSETAGGSPM